MIAFKDTQCFPQLAGFHVECKPETGSSYVPFKDGDGSVLGRYIYFDEEGVAHKTSVDGEVIAKGFLVGDNGYTIVVYDEENTEIRSYRLV